MSKALAYLLFSEKEISSQTYSIEEQNLCIKYQIWIGKMWHIYTMEYYAAIKKDEFVSFVGTWMNLENIILSKLTQEQKMKYRIFSLTGG